ncbi:MAG: type II toxin-antitoxin system prevent-host-death family antitoxin [Candidatus Methylumidiphilus sp.]
MQFYTLQQASADLDQVIARAVYDQEEAAIVSENGTVFLVPQEEFESMRETLRLMSDRRSFNALLEGHCQRDAGQVPDFPSVEKIFYDLQDTHS